MTIWENIWPVAILVVAIGVGAGMPIGWIRRLNGAVIGALIISLFMPLVGVFRPDDALAFWFNITATVFGIFALWFSGPYIQTEGHLHYWDDHRIKGYFLGLYTFIGSLMAMALVANYLLLWVALEIATLSSVYLVETSGTRESLEAAWKYLVITETGGLAGLLGTVLVLLGTGRSLAAWSLTPSVVGHPLSTTAVIGGMLLATIGYGTKAGLAPFHTWLPDAHSEAPAPVSALLSGVKLAGAIIILDRLFTLTSPAVPRVWGQDILITLGLLSLGVAASFVGFQHELKRLWAYSSIEHMGLIALGLGFGGFAILGALLNIL